MAVFEPKILAFCCNYCAYAAADLAGVSRIQYPPNVKIVRVPCSGRVDVVQIFRAFEKGVDGVVVAGCLKGGCHFIQGNLFAEARVKFAKDILEAIGIERDRLEMVFNSSAMASELSETFKDMIERVRQLGPFPKKVKLTKRSPEINKRVLFYSILRNIALRKPEKYVPVPSELEEFGRLDFNFSKCIGCKKCKDACREEAVDAIEQFDLPLILKTVRRGEKTTKRQLLYETIARLAVKPPSTTIPVPKELSEFYKMCYNPVKCTMCKKCIEACPEQALSVVKELDIQAIVPKVS